MWWYKVVDNGEQELETLLKLKFKRLGMVPFTLRLREAEAFLNLSEDRILAILERAKSEMAARAAIIRLLRK